MRIEDVGRDAQTRYFQHHTEGKETTMRHPSLYANAAKKATNVSLAEPLLAEAKELRINVSQAAEAGVASVNRDRPRFSGLLTTTDCETLCGAGSRGLLRSAGGHGVSD